MKTGKLTPQQDPQIQTHSTFISRLASILNQHKAIGLLLLITAALCTINQPYYPPIWHDEGVFFHAPRNLLLHGQYATSTSEGLQLFDGHLSGIGPVVVWPIYWVFRIWGIGLTQARAVIGVYTLLAVVGLYLLGLELTTRRAALMAVLLFLSGFVGQMLNLSRSLMGELPSLALIVVGLWTWLRASRIRDGRAIVWLILSGLFLGAAITAKPQSVLVLPMIAVLWLLDRVYYRTLRHRHFLLPLLSSTLLPVLWILYQTLTLMSSQSTGDLGHVGQMTALTLSNPSLSKISINLTKLALDHHLAIWGPALVYVLLMATERNLDGLGLLLVPLCIVGWLGWWTFLSIGWDRYAFVPLSLATLPTAMLADKALGKLVLSRESLQKLKPADTVPIFVAVILYSLLGFGLVSQMRELRLAASTAQYDFAALIESIVPETAIIESWEWEIDPLAQRTFHHPPGPVDEAAVFLSETGLDYVYDYDWQASGAEYLIVGPFGSNLELYKKDLEVGCCELIAQMGNYELYKVIR
jgi:4-amino-4-deoxy-L-arabinose transferase-like glycosyltransferase